MLSRTPETARPPSPAEEWLLDNAHVVEDQIREIKEDLAEKLSGRAPTPLARQDARLSARVRPLSGLPSSHRRPGRAPRLSRVTCSRIKRSTPSPSASCGRFPSCFAWDWSSPWAHSRCPRRSRAIETAAMHGHTGHRGGQTPAKVAEALSSLEAGDPPVTAALVVELFRHLRGARGSSRAAVEWVRSRATP